MSFSQNESAAIWETYCGEGIDYTDPESYNPPCEFPYINSNFGTELPYGDDCDWTYLDSDPSGSLKNIVYFMFAIGPAIGNMLHLLKMKKIRTKQKRSNGKYTIVDKILIVSTLFSLSLAVNCTDLGGSGGFLPIWVHTPMQGFGMVAAFTLIKMLCVEWVSTVNQVKNGGTKKAPMWIYLLFLFTGELTPL